jgi:hypothetical protein
VGQLLLARGTTVLAAATVFPDEAQRRSRSAVARSTQPARLLALDAEVRLPSVPMREAETSCTNPTADGATGLPSVVEVVPGRSRRLRADTRSGPAPAKDPATDQSHARLLGDVS